MVAETDYYEGQQLLDSAYQILTALDEEEELTRTWPPETGGFLDEREYLGQVVIAHVDDDRIFRNLEAVYNPQKEALEVRYTAWKDYPIPNDEDLRLEKRGRISEVDNQNNVSAVIREVYERSLEVDEDELLEEGEQVRVNSGENRYNPDWQD